MNVRTHIRLNRVSSTNEFAQFLVSGSSPAEGTVISANDQYAGRGQAGRSWHASPGKNIAASFIFYPDFIPVVQQFQLSKLFSVSAVHYFNQFLQEGRLRIKWPNDLLIGLEKAAGLLIRFSTTAEKIRLAVFGIGVNVYEEQFPPDIPNPVSLFSAGGAIPDIPGLIDGFQEHLCADYEKFKAGCYTGLDDEYTRSLYGMGQSLHFSTPDQGRFEGIITGVDEFGRLLVASAGMTRRFQSGNLVFHLSEK